ncbi:MULTISPECIES: hypothetical protein [Paraburkholderia]|uniref:Uncharacterized protein n=1 Tax=Paraburkholderia acidicola TaxID=1912599 RepID=A0ABV1LYE1_9BURK
MSLLGTQNTSIAALPVSPAISAPHRREELGDLVAELLDEIQAAADDRRWFSSSEARLASGDGIWG